MLSPSQNEGKDPSHCLENEENEWGYLTDLKENIRVRETTYKRHVLDQGRQEALYQLSITDFNLLTMTA